MKLNLVSVLFLLLSSAAMSQQNIQYFKDSSEKLKIYKVWDYSFDPHENKEVRFFDGKEERKALASYFRNMLNINSKLKAHDVNCFTGVNSVLCLGYNTKSDKIEHILFSNDSAKTFDPSTLDGQKDPEGYTVFSEKNLTITSKITPSAKLLKKMTQIDIGETVSEVEYHNDNQAPQETVLVHATKIKDKEFELSYSKPDDNSNEKYNHQIFLLTSCDELFATYNIPDDIQLLATVVLGNSALLTKKEKSPTGFPAEERTITITVIEDDLLKLELLKEDDATYSSKPYVTEYCTR
jgi:hypothetical protein